jgi:solute:Na+ symporter, SSS family
MIHWLDIFIIVAMFLIITVAGHFLTEKKITNVSGFFKGGNNMPWWAVSASIIATKISALTFIALPAKVFVDGGNLEYALLIGGFILGNVLMAVVFVKPYYKENIYSPYDFISKRIHPNAAIWARLLFLIGAVLSQAVRLLATAVVLQVISGMSIMTCIIIIIAFSVLWSWIGGIQTVIWTDFLLFFIFILGGIVAISFSISGIQLSLPEMMQVLDDKAKLALLDISLDPRKTYTLWAGLIGAAVFELGSNSIDQVITQRIMCCRNFKQAKLAVFVSASSVLPTILFLFVGLAIFGFFHQNPLPVEFSYLREPGQDGIFPYFVANHIPVGLSGIIIAGMFAAGISTLDSALTAFSQTTVVGIKKTIDTQTKLNDSKLLSRSRYYVVIWGIIIAIIAITVQTVTSGNEKGLIDIGLQVPGFIYGSLLGLALLSLVKNINWSSAVIGSIAGCCSTIILWIFNIGFFWWYPVAAIVTFVIGYSSAFLFINYFRRQFNVSNRV